MQGRNSCKQALQGNKFAAVRLKGPLLFQANVDAMIWVGLLCVLNSASSKGRGKMLDLVLSVRKLTYRILDTNYKRDILQ